MSELARWNNFYVIVGSAAAALIGLQFVAMALIASAPQDVTAEGGAAFGSPTVVHFGVTLFLSALLQAPWQTIAVAADVWGLLGLGGLVYSVIVTWRMIRQSAYKPVFEDWLFHSWLPLIAYSILAFSALACSSHPRQSLFAVGGGALLLLFDGIHNAWDNVAYHVLVRLPKQHARERRAQRQLQDRG
jgi:hypothetical protein